MEAPVVKGDGKIILSFKENQCVVETEYDPPTPQQTAAAVSSSLMREQQSSPFYQTIMAGNPQSSSWLTALVVFQSITMIVGVCILVGIGVYLVQQDNETGGQYKQAQIQLKSQEATIQLMQVELGRLHSEIQRIQPDGKKSEIISKQEAEVPASERPVIETNSTNK